MRVDELTTGVVVPRNVTAVRTLPSVRTAAAAGTVACLVVAAYGSYLSWRVGFGLDSGLAAQYGFFAATMLVVAVPFQAVEGALAAAAASSARERIATRSA